MSDRYGIAIIGCGMMGQAHARAWAQRPDAELRVVHDPDLARADALGASHSARAVSDWIEAAQADDIEIVSVCTPVHLHHEIAIAAARAGKHVLCEKPVALSLEQADAMAAAAAEAQVQMGISYQYRGRARYQCYKKLIASGALAGPLLARFVDFREVRPKTAMHRTTRNGGPIIDMAGHFFDLMRWLTGEEPLTVFATGHVMGAGKPRLAGLTDLAIDAADIHVRYAGGHVASVSVHWGLPEDTPTYTNEYLATADAWTRVGPESVEVQSGSVSTRHALPSDASQQAWTIDGLMRAIAGDPSQLVTVYDGRAALAVSLAAIQSIESGQAVALA